VIKCPSCHSDNQEDSRYCNKCGSQLEIVPDFYASPTLAMPPPAASDFALGSLFAGRYRIIEDLGQGGMGRVYKALDTEINEKVALKLILPEIAADEKTINRFQNELKLARKVSHKNICRMFHLSKEKDTYYLIMEYVQGQSLKSMIQMTKHLSLQTAVHIAKQVCEGLAEAHREGIIHRDLKPQNIMVDEQGDARVMDFGLARSLEGKKGTRLGAILGTADYMSPEQAEGQEVDHRTDIYSLGIVLYEMATGKVPFESDSLLALLTKQKNEIPLEPVALKPDLPEALNRLIVKCLEKKKENRYQSAEEVFAELNEIGKGLGTRAIPKVAKKSTFVLPILAFLVLLAAGFLAWKYFSGRPRAAPEDKLSVAVINFINQTGDPNYDYLQDAIPNLLITALEESNQLQVTTWERLFDLLKRLGKKDLTLIDRDLGFELCRLDGIQAIILGSFTKAGNIFATSVNVLDVKSKKLIKSAGSRGVGVDSILKTQIDDLSREISSGIGVEEQVTAAQVSPIREVTTSSMEAYNAFLKGRDAYENWHFGDAQRLFRRAVEIDPEFAMAYIYLAQANAGLNDLAGRNSAYEMSKKFSKRLGGKERLYAEALGAVVEQNQEKYFGILQQIAAEYPKEKRVHLDLGANYLGREKVDEAMTEVNKALELDPEFGPALNWLAYAYINKKDFAKALSCLQKYALVSPDDCNPYDSMGELYLAMGDLDRAIEKYEEAIKIKPDFGAQIKAAYCYALKEDYTSAVRLINHYIPVAPSEGVQAMAYEFRGLYSSLQGNLEQALADFDRAAELFDSIQNFSFMGSMFLRKNWICYEWGKNELCRKYVQAWYHHQAQHKTRSEALTQAQYQGYLGLLDLRENRLEEALTRLAEVKHFLDTSKNPQETRVAEGIYYFLSAETDLTRGQVDEAISEFQKMPRIAVSLSQEVTAIIRNLPWMDDFLGRALEKKGEMSKAIAEYERLLDPKNTGNILVHPFSRFRLAKLYEATGQREKAVEQYEKVAAIWANADPGLLLVDEAREKLQALRPQ